MRSGMVLIDSTTCDPTATRIVGAALAARGCAMIDAALGRMPKEAKQGPSFAPEILCRVRLDDPMRAKQLRRRSWTWPRRA